MTNTIMQCIACNKELPEFVPNPPIEGEEQEYYPDPPMCLLCEESYSKHYEEQERDHKEEMRTSLRICPGCGERSVKVTTSHTRNYGGGTDTFEKCQDKDDCGYAEVFV